MPLASCLAITTIFNAHLLIKKFAFEEIIEISSFAEITNIKKLQGYDNAYRIRIGDYRLGIIFDSETLIFERVLHRK